MPYPRHVPSRTDALLESPVEEESSSKAWVKEVEVRAGAVDGSTWEMRSSGRDSARAEATPYKCGPVAPPAHTAQRGRRPTSAWAGVSDVRIATAKARRKRGFFNAFCQEVAADGKWI